MEDRLWEIPVSAPPPDWSTVRAAVDLAAVATQLLGQAPGRRGERGRRLWWRCPFHEDKNPSFCIEPGKPWWKCFGCDAHGDAAELVMRLTRVDFPEAVASLAGEQKRVNSKLQNSKPLGSWSSGAWSSRVTPSSAAVPIGPSGMPTGDAQALVEASAARLWMFEGEQALGYLRGRGLTNATIKAARLGTTPPLDLPGRPQGIVVPWFDGDRLVMVKLRQPDGVKPKYRELYRDRPMLYPGPSVIRPGRPLVIVEGEPDALLLGQELDGMVPVVTLGSASARPLSSLIGRMLAAFPWFVATDNDSAGDKAAAGWPPVARRVRPPGDFKDWTEVFQGKVNLRRWWTDRLGGNEAPPLFTWEELAAWRWGDAVGDPEPGIVVDRPDRSLDRMRLQVAADPQP